MARFPTLTKIGRLLVAVFGAPAAAALARLLFGVTSLFVPSFFPLLKNAPAMAAVQLAGVALWLIFVYRYYARRPVTAPAAQAA